MLDRVEGTAMLRNKVAVSWLIFTGIMLWGAGLVVAAVRLLG